MNSSQIHKILSRDPVSSRYFGGVFPSVKIPVIQKYPSALVLNSDKHDEKGSHWVAVFIEDQENLEFFDSFGLPPQTYGEDISRFVKNYPRIHWNKTTLQSLTSNVCGQYCIFFIVKRCHGLCMKSIVSVLSRKKNDFRMYQFVKKRYGVNVIFKK